MKSEKTILAALLCSCAVLVPQAAWAEQAEPAEAGASADAGDIVVTARKREEKLQDVPVSVTAFSGEQLERQGVTSFDGLAQSNPNVRIAQLPSSAVSFGIAIRGNVQSGNTLAVDSSVGTYVDGVLVARPMGTVCFTTDVTSVQTLKGPQAPCSGAIPRAVPC